MRNRELENVFKQEKSNEVIEEAAPVVEKVTEAVKKHNESFFMAGESMRQYLQLMDNYL